MSGKGQPMIIGKPPGQTRPLLFLMNSSCQHPVQKAQC
ncbi:hypothetical protein B4135_0505 [Caldibacillus debilis]|uniref:Uncharacterized protein n=1 Tax=Caldibacillus debilis TaxID=301148 RepID=A0A150L8Z7_9BACI|nr:hypothetical protein B4135_0505 [Caldibacillus debilis]